MTLTHSQLQKLGLGHLVDFRRSQPLRFRRAAILARMWSASILDIRALHICCALEMQVALPVWPGGHQRHQSRGEL